MKRSILTFSKKVIARIQRAYHEHIRNDFLDEVDLLFKSFSQSCPNGAMYDVGAHYGSSLKKFANAGWRIEAFEPDINNREVLSNKFSHFQNLRIHSVALGAEDKKSVNFYNSPESSGVSGLSAFLDSHKVNGQVSMQTLKTFMSESDSPPPDFLKIDTEGHDLFVLKGYPWGLHNPRFLICEFEDSKTLSLGYDCEQLCDFIRQKGYHLILSEWHPIQRYGALHRWKGFRDAPSELSKAGAWGNIVAFKNLKDYEYACKIWKV
jgi:FkbM family methyltransferase